MQTTSNTADVGPQGQEMGTLGPKLRHTLTVVERQNELKTKAKRTLQKLDEGKLSFTHLISTSQF
jgi:hypothetical protein